MNKKGFTLIEVMMTIMVFTILSGAIFSFVTMLYRAQEILFTQSEVVEEARRGMALMVGEMREANVGEDGSYVISRADDHEIVFYSDVSDNGKTEKIRYYINPAGGRIGTEIRTCTSFEAGGSCQVLFSGFLENDLKNATLSVSVEGDLDHPAREYADVLSGSELLGTLCSGGGTCGQCVGEYQDLRSFDVTSFAVDDILSVSVSASPQVDPICQWEDPNHSIKAMFVLSWEEEPLPQQSDLFIREVVETDGWPPSYDDENAEMMVISRDVRNGARGEPVFLYYDKNNQLIENPGSRIKDITMVEIRIILNPDPGRPPDDIFLSSAVRLRNITSYEE